MTTGDRQAGGFFATIAEAALEYARMLGPRKSVEAAERAAMLTKRKSLGVQQDRHWIQKMSAMGHVSSEPDHQQTSQACPSGSQQLDVVRQVSKVAPSRASSNRVREGVVLQ